MMAQLSETILTKVYDDILCHLALINKWQLYLIELYSFKT